MKYRIECEELRTCIFANSRDDLIQQIHCLRDKKITDIRKIYRSGVTDSVLDQYRSIIK